jgi:PAS domain S-box-containing protein
VSSRKKKSGPSAPLPAAAVVASLGSLALTRSDLHALMSETARQLSTALQADLVGVWELDPDGKSLTLRAGVGWQKGLVGALRSSSTPADPLGLTLAAGEPIAIDDVAKDARFKRDSVLQDHSVSSGISVVIKGSDRPHGLIGIYSNKPRAFSPDEVNLLRAVSNVLAAAIRDCQSEQALSDSASRVRAIVNTMVDGIITIDERGLIDSMNPAAEKLFGYRASELLGRNVSLLMPNPYRLEHDRYIEHYLRTGKAKIIGIGREVVGQRKDGSVFPMDLAVSEFTVGNRRMFAGVVRDIAERRRLEKEILNAAAEEQRRIGQDLHDGLCQQLAGIAFAVEVLQRKLEARSAPEAVGIRKVGELVDQAITQARDLARGLQPVALESGGLGAALEALAAKVQSMFHVSCVFVSDHRTRVADNAVATHLYRIAQEAISNAVRHGKAKAITIDLASDPQAVHLTIRDNGIGFSNARGDGKGIGLQTMKYRASVVGGALTVQAGENQGTIVSCTIPRRIIEHGQENSTGGKSEDKNPRRGRPSHRPRKTRRTDQPGA